MKNIVFMGSMNFAVPILEKCIEHYHVSLVVTQPDRPFGRKRILKGTPVKECALVHNLPVFQPEVIRKDYQPILDASPDVIIVAAYGQMIPKTVLDFPVFHSINVHASLLPLYRGGSPMHKAIQNGDLETGVTIMYMAPKMDSGDIISQASLPILMDDDVASIEAKLSVLGADLLVDTLSKVFKREETVTPQDESKVTYAYNIKREEEHLSFQQTAKEVYNHIRGYHPWPLTYFTLENQNIKVYEASVYSETEVRGQIGEMLEVTKKECLIQANPGIISLKRIQVPGKKEMDIVSFLSGNQDQFFAKGKLVN